MGSYLHGLFSGDAFRGAFLSALGGQTNGTSHAATVEATLDALADHLEASMDIDGILGLARPPVPQPS
jgi:adenosylcobyric acid synthase